MKALADSDKMPWGKHAGKKMEDLPAGYLHWLWKEGKKLETTTCPVAAYIKASIPALEKDLPDAIWT